MHRILLIDDQETIHEDYRKVLGPSQQPSTVLDRAAAELFGEELVTTITWQGFELASALQGEEGLKLVRQSLEDGRPFAMAFVDIRMPPGWDGVKTVRKIWEVDPEILVVICSAYSDYSWEDMVSQLGRNDRFLILKKPFDNIEVRQCAMVLTERWSVSRTDVLTGLLNRRAFQGRSGLEWSRSTRHELPLACAILDLDFFKQINDEFGHTAGDVVLKVVARQLQKQCRGSDSVCRYGGEEFCVLLPHTDEQGAASWAELARLAIADIDASISERSIRVTASFGVAARVGGDDRIERMIDRADEALMAAKRAGRNRVARASAVCAQRLTDAAAASRLPVVSPRAQLIETARTFAASAAELSEIVASAVVDPLPVSVERISKLKDLLRRLIKELHRPDVRPPLTFDPAIIQSALNMQTNPGN